MAVTPRALPTANKRGSRTNDNDEFFDPYRDSSDHTTMMTMTTTMVVEKLDQ